MLKRLAAGVVVLASLVIGPSGTVASADESRPIVPLGLELPATNGYEANVIAGYDPSVGRAAANLFQEIDVHLVTTGGETTERSTCGGKPHSFPAGRWEGTIRFRGEGGFAEVDASSAKAVVGPFLDLLCADEETGGIGGHSPGALLELWRRHGTEALELSVRKNKRVGPTRIRVEEHEHRGSLEIDRGVSLVAPTKAFDFEFPPGRATVEPPKPFSGSLSLTRRPGSSPLVKGNLKVDLPGREAVPILGFGHLRASLVRAVLNPSHPF